MKEEKRRATILPSTQPFAYSYATNTQCTTKKQNFFYFFNFIKRLIKFLHRLLINFIFHSKLNRGGTPLQFKQKMKITSYPIDGNAGALAAVESDGIRLTGRHSAGCDATHNQYIDDRSLCSSRSTC